MSIFASAGIASATDDNGNEWRFKELEGKKRHNAIDRFTSDADVNTLLQYARKQSWSLNKEELEALKQFIQTSQNIL